MSTLEILPRLPEETLAKAFENIASQGYDFLVVHNATWGEWPVTFYETTTPVRETHQLEDFLKADIGESRCTSISAIYDLRGETGHITSFSKAVRHDVLRDSSLPLLDERAIDAANQYFIERYEYRHRSGLGKLFMKAPVPPSPDDF